MFTFLVLLITATIMVETRLISLEVHNKQQFPLHFPSFLVSKGAHKNCFGSIKPQESGRFLVESDLNDEFVGSLSIPVQIPFSLLYLHISIEFKQENTVSLALNSLNSLEIQEDLTEYKIVSTSWEKCSLGKGFLAEVYLNERNVQIHFGMEPEKFDSNAVYKLIPYETKIRIVPHFEGGRPSIDAPISYNDLLNGWIINRVVEDGYTIRPFDQPEFFLPKCVASSGFGHSLYYTDCNQDDPNVLWRIEKDLWGRWKISSYIDDDSFWVYDLNYLELDMLGFDNDKEPCSQTWEFLVCPIPRAYNLKHLFHIEKILIE